MTLKIIKMLTLYQRVKIDVHLQLFMFRDEKIQCTFTKLTDIFSK